MKIVFEDEKPLSWNVYYAGMHWTKRNAHAARVHALVEKNTQHLKRFTVPVKITITVFFKGRSYDVDNVECKTWIDGLKKYVLQDDTPEYVREFTVRYGGKSPVGRIEIEIEPTETS